MSTTPTYFGGSTVKGGRVRRLKASSFKELVDNYIFIPVPFPMSRAEFLANPERDKLKDGPYICACSYDFDEGHREDFTATYVTLVILDLDEGEFVKDFFESPDTISDGLAPFNFVCWTTAKHTPEAPRLKIAIDVTPCPPAMHRRFVSMALKRLGIPDKFKGSRESKTLSLPQYRPIQFAGEDFDAVIASRTTGRPATPADLPAEDAVEDDERTYACDLGDDLASLAFLPCAGIEVEDIREPLFAIDPDCEYQTWTHIACALRHQFMGSEEESRHAYEMFDEWSSGGSKYKGEDETFGKWRSFKPYAKGRSPRTIRTLFKHAKEAGWSDSHMVSKVKQSAEEWIAACGDVDTLMAEGARRIADMPFKNPIIEESLVNTLRAALKGFKVSIDKATIKKQVADARKRDRTEAVREEKPAWMMPFCFIGPENTFHNVATGVRYSPAAFDNTFSRHLVAPKDDGEGDSTRPVVLPTAKALNEAKIQVVEGAIYDPREQGINPYFELAGRTFVNTYLRSSVPHECEEHSAYAGQLFCALMSAIIGVPAYERTLLDFFAHVVQFPGVKMPWAPFIQSAQGGGKGTLIDCLAAAIGVINVKAITAGALNSDFNDWRAGAQFVFIDEIKSPGKSRHEVQNKLKDAISNARIPVNQKFKDVTMIDNVTNYLCSTNNADALVLEDSDRRYMVILSRIQFKDQVLALNETGIFTQIHDLIKTHPGAFRHFFLNHQISADFPTHGPAPDTIYRAQVIEEAKNPLLIRIEELIDDERFPLIGDDVIHYTHLESLTADLARHNAKISHYLRGIGYELHSSERVEIDGERTHVWVHIRNYFEELGEPEDLLAMRLKASGKEI